MTTPQPPPTPASAIYTLGCGEMLPEHICRRLESLEVEFIVEVRSKPFAIDRPDLYPSQLQALFEEREFKYLDMSAQLGDRPEDLSVYARGGQRIDYQKCRQRAWAQEGLARLLKAYELGLRLCLLGREPDPCKSHLARFIGESLWEDHHIESRHLTAGGSWMSQADVRQQLARWNEPIDLSAADGL